MGSKKGNDQPTHVWERKASISGREHGRMRGSLDGVNFAAIGKGAFVIPRSHMIFAQC